MTHAVHEAKGYPSPMGSLVEIWSKSTGCNKHKSSIDSIIHSSIHHPLLEKAIKVDKASVWNRICLLNIRLVNVYCWDVFKTCKRFTVTYSTQFHRNIREVRSDPSYYSL